MILSALQEYGIRCLLQLAKQPAGRQMTVREIAEAEGLSSDYVEKILSHLRGENLAVSIRGTHGGYLLARPANSITLAEALQSLGGVLYGKGFCDRFSGLKDECTHLTDCGIRSVWAFLTREVYRVSNRVSLADFLKEESQVMSTLQAMSVKTENGKQKPENG